MKKLFSVAALLITSTQVFADQKLNNLDEFMVGSFYLIALCDAKSRGAMANIEMNGDVDVLVEIVECRNKGNSELKKLYPKARAFLSKKPAAQKILKEFYAASVISLADMYPDLSLPKMDFDRRKSEDARKIAELQTRLQIEIE